MSSDEIDEFILFGTDPHNNPDLVEEILNLHYALCCTYYYWGVTVHMAPAAFRNAAVFH